MLEEWPRQSVQWPASLARAWDTRQFAKQEQSYFLKKNTPYFSTALNINGRQFLTSEQPANNDWGEYTSNVLVTIVYAKPDNSWVSQENICTILLSEIVLNYPAKIQEKMLKRLLYDLGSTCAIPNTQSAKVKCQTDLVKISRNPTGINLIKFRPKIKIKLK